MTPTGCQDLYTQCFSNRDGVQEEIRHCLKFEGGRGELQAPLMWRMSGIGFHIDDHDVAQVNVVML
jgi:hypothetical protein